MVLGTAARASETPPTLICFPPPYWPVLTLAANAPAMMTRSRGGTVEGSRKGSMRAAAAYAHQWRQYFVCSMDVLEAYLTQDVVNFGQACQVIKRQRMGNNILSTAPLPTYQLATEYYSVEDCCIPCMYNMCLAT